MLTEELKQKVHRYIITQTDFLKLKDRMNDDQLRAFVDSAIVQLCREQNIESAVEQRTTIIRDFVSALVSMGPLQPLMEDKAITEIMVNGIEQIYIQRDGRLEMTDIQFETNQNLMYTIQKILAGSGTNKRVDESSPYVDLSLPDGSRVNIILPPCSMVGPVVTIRKFSEDINTVEDLVKLGELNQDIATFLIAAMKAKINVIFCGSTGAGKTTALNVFSTHIPEEERIITIEDTAELRLHQRHVVSLCSKPANIEGKGEITMRDLFVNALRMRPDRIIVGEVRGGEALDMIQAITSGHSGSLAIVHAETTDDCFSRLITMMLMTGIPLATAEIKKQIAKAIDVMVHIELFMDGKRRVTCITDLSHDEQTDKVIMHDIFKFKETNVNKTGQVIGNWVKNRKRPSFISKFEKRRIQLPEGFFE